MSTREEILAALEANPAGLTSKDLAPLCPAAECDEMIVGRTIANLRAEGAIHPGSELREGGTIWILGAPPDVKREPVLSLAGGDQRQPPAVSEAAAAIARMRGRAAPAPRQQRSPAPPAPSSQEEPMSKKKDQKPPVADRVVSALKEHGQLSIDDMAKHAGTTKATLYTMLGTLQKKHGLVKVERGVYALKGSTPKPPPASDALQKGADRGRKSSPAPARASRPAANGNAYADAIEGLRAKREELLGEVTKVDRAIEAIEALA